MPIVELQDLSNRLLRPYSGMTDGQLKRGEGFRRDCPNGLFIGESALVVERALDAGLRPVSMLVDNRWFAHDRPLIERVLKEHPQACVFKATPAQFRDLTGYEVVRGALACFERPQARTVWEVVAGARRVVVLEDLTNYANMGAVFRSAAALGVDGVLVSPSCHDPYYRRCARVSMGAVFQVPWARIPKEGEATANTLVRLHREGFSTVALALREDALDLRDPCLSTANRLAVVLGTEGRGLQASTIAACDYTVCIPMSHDVDSLNVAACGAIVFWELCYNASSADKAANQTIPGGPGREPNS